MTSQERIAYFDASAGTRDAWKRKNRYYHRAIRELVRFLVPEGQQVLEIGSDTGDLLAALKPSRGLGVDISPRMVEKAREKYPALEWRVDDAENLKTAEKFDFVALSDLLGYVDDIQKVFENLRAVTHERSRIIITHYNYLWEPVMRFAERLRLKAVQPLQNWVAEKDVENMLCLAGFEVVKSGRRMLCPVSIPLVSTFCNRILVHLPFFRIFGVIQYYVARRQPEGAQEYSVSIVVPCRNEKGNIEGAIRRIPPFGTYNEVIFVEGHSTDGTLDEIRRVAQVYAGKRNIRWAAQDGKGKKDAVRKGFAMAKSEVLMILDADLTVAPEDLPKFYKALVSGRGEFINGSRLVYPLEKEAMRFFNVLGNKFFSVMFSWLLGQRIKDTLCGTKALFKKDYEMIAANRSYFGDFDPFGDFDLLFGAAKLNLKIVEMPVRYHARAYGATNISRWWHGWLLLKMVLFAMWKMKFI